MTIAPANDCKLKPLVDAQSVPLPQVTERLLVCKDANQVAVVVFDALARADGTEQLSEAFGERAKILGQSALNHELSAGISVHRGIFGPESSTRASAWAEPVMFNDLELYGRNYLVSALNQLCATAAAPELVRASLTNVALWTVAKYFDSYRSSEASPAERQEFFMNHNGPIALAELRHKRFVQCSERAPLYASVMATLGFQILTVCSECTITSEPEMHTYNIIASRGRLLISDITNPVVCRYLDGRRSFSMSVYEIPRNQLESFARGAELKVIHRDMQETSPGTFELSEATERTYRGPSYCQDIMIQFFAETALA